MCALERSSGRVSIRRTIARRARRRIPPKPQTPSGQRWLVTGDLGFRDPQGYFWLTGRAKDLIIRGGHNIDPSAIEQPLQAHPGVQFAAAVGRPDAHSGELPVAHVQPRAGHSVTENELMEVLKGQIRERAAMPKSINLIETMPLTAVGEINKPELRRREMEHALREALLLAGVQPGSVRVEFDAGGKGPVATVELTDPAFTSLAETISGRFSMPCHIVSRRPR